MKEKMTPICPESLELLSQIARSLSILLGKNEEEYRHAEELYQQGIAVMLAAAPSAFQREWVKIQMSRVRIGSERISSLSQKEILAVDSARKQYKGEELTEEEERAYREAMGDNPFPLAYP